MLAGETNGEKNQTTGGKKGTDIQRYMEEFRPVIFCARLARMTSEGYCFVSIYRSVFRFQRPLVAFWLCLMR